MSATTAAPRRAARPKPKPVPPKRHLRVVDGEPRRHSGLFLVIYVIVIVGVVMGAVSLNAFAATDSVEIRELRAELVQDQRSYDQLVADVATLEDPTRIRELAELMGMIPADGVRLVTPSTGLDTDGSDVSGVIDDSVKSVIGQSS